MFGLASIVAFAVALILDLAGVSKGHLNYVLFALIGLLCLAVHVTTIGGWWGPARRG
jgi:hypothetical protein